MPYVIVDGKQHALSSGDNDIGAMVDARAQSSVSAEPGVGNREGGITVVLTLAGDGSTVVRRPSGAEEHAVVKVNGVLLGPEPMPLIHGDKIEIAGREFYFGDDRQSGNTQYVRRVRIPEAAGRGTAHLGGTAAGSASFAELSSGLGERVEVGPGGWVDAGSQRGSTARPGGRLVSLVDGREYAIPADGLVLGRDPTCDVVIPVAAVSRKHAVITPQGEGYVLTDTSANGVLVNGVMARSPAVLGRGDILGIGGEEFRFSADVGGGKRPRRTQVLAGGPAPAVTGQRRGRSDGTKRAEAMQDSDAPSPLLWIALVIVVAAGAYFLFMGR